MRVDLGDRQRTEHQDQGKITGADGQGYARRGTKAKRSVADGLVAGGAPLVLDMYSRGQFEWVDGDEAIHTWANVRPYVKHHHDHVSTRCRGVHLFQMG